MGECAQLIAGIRVIAHGHPVENHSAIFERMRKISRTVVDKMVGVVEIGSGQSGACCARNAIVLDIGLKKAMRHLKT